jgi:hypothetical protein
MKPALPVLAAALAGCCFVQERPASIEVREVARGGYCNTPGEAPRARLLYGAKAVADWQALRNVSLGADALAPEATFVIVEHGMRPTGGYGITVATGARRRGEVVVLQATFSGPPPGAMTTQALSSPCVLVQLPDGRYTGVEVQDEAGRVRATGSFTEAPGQPVPEAVR